MDPELYARELIAAAHAAAAAALNAAAEEVYQLSQMEVPKGDEPDRTEERFGQTLAESGKGPLQDPELAATPEKLEATVVYDQPYAHAQHEGAALMSRATGEVAWQVTQYTEAGTKDHYLEDPLKAVAARLEGMAGAEFATRIATL